jgi:23S rRNA pseudouridine1911/1915/1917 synthase
VLPDEPRLLAETEDLLVLCKPAGVPVFPPHGDPGGASVHRWLAPRVDPGLAWPEGYDLGIAHRLDIPTSGQLLVARTPEALLRLRAAFSEKRLDKRYRFLTERRPAWTEHTVGHRLAHDKKRRSRMTFERGRSTPHRGRWLDAETRFQRVGPGPAGTTLWGARMRTGVMHQIRVHAASCGLALAGDRLYGGRPLSLPRPEPVRFCLHHLGVGRVLGVPVPDAPLPGFWAVPAGALS